MTLYRVSFRRRLFDEWQTEPAVSAQEAHRIARSYRALLWQAKVQWWHAKEQRWIG